MSLKYEPVSVEIESCTDLVQLSIPDVQRESGADVFRALQPSGRLIISTPDEKPRSEFTVSSSCED